MTPAELESAQPLEPIAALAAPIRSVPGTESAAFVILGALVLNQFVNISGMARIGTW